MIQNLSINDFLDYKESFIDYNQVEIYKSDIVNIPELLDFFSKYTIYIEDSIFLNKFNKNIQNQIGLIYLNHFGFCILYKNLNYLNRDKLNDLFYNSNKLLDIIKIAEVKTKEADINTINSSNLSVEEKMNKIEIINNDSKINPLMLSENDLNLIILNFFSKNYRNFISQDKSIKQSSNFYDVEMSPNKFYKITDPKEFILTMFTKFIRMRKGEIPFSSNYGSNLREIIQTKYQNFTKDLLFEEISNFLNEFSNYSDEISLVDLVLKDSTIDDSTKLKIIVTIQINYEYVQVDMNI